MINILWRNLKWRLQNPISIIITILQPFIWLVLYSTIASNTINNEKIINYTAFILPGIIILVIFSVCCSGGIINFIMKSSGSYYRILISPIKRSFIIFGQMLESILLSFIEIFILFIVSLFFSIELSISLLDFLLIIILIFITSFFISSLAYAISLFLPNEVIYEMLMTAIILPIFFLSSALFPSENLSGSLKNIVFLNPFTHVINLLRKLLYSKIITLEEVLPVILLLSIISSASFLLALWKLKNES